MMVTEARPTRDLLSRLESLGDENRLRLLTLLDRHELTVSELVSVLQLPQSSVSRHLRVLADDGWVRRRQEGKIRYYRMTGELPPGAGELWRVTAASLAGAPWVALDAERTESVLAERGARAVAFFSESAADWDRVRDDLYGRDARFAALFGLLDPAWVVGDLGTGTGTLAAMVAPFVRRVVAVDRSPEMLAAAQLRLGERGNVDLRQGDLEALPVADDELDLAVLMLVLHFAVDPGRVLAETARTLAPGGRLLLLDMRAHAREEYRETMGHVWPGFTEDQLRGWARDAGFEGYRHVTLAPGADASGPALFAGTARKPSGTPPSGVPRNED